MPEFAAPLLCPTRTVEQAWIDYNGHMNMAYYSLVFDQALDHVFDLLGIGAAYVREQHGSCFTMEAHITYLQEVQLGDPLRIEFQLLDWDSKRLHYFERMYHASAGYLAATSEQICMHVDMRSRRSAPFPAAIAGANAALAQAHAALPKDAQVSHRIGIPRKD